MFRLWLDDKRPPPEGWVWTTTVEDTLAFLQGHHVVEVSLDYDLDNGRKGTEVMDVIAEMAKRGEQIPIVHVHSANPIGGARLAWMRREVEKISG